jgi:S1/P1 Nuclease
LLVASVIATDAYAWGDEGLKIVCEIAFTNVKPSTRTAIVELIRADGKFDTFSDSCIWPDHPRKRAPEHFVNLSRDATGLTSDCGVASPCVVSAIAQDFGVLSDKTAPTAQRAASLKFLGHWVGDVHQPLHVSFEDDRGGNEIRVTGECTSNLHSAWDSCLVKAAVGGSVRDAAASLASSIAAAQAQEWRQSAGPKQWANESLQIAESVQTTYCEMHGKPLPRLPRLSSQTRSGPERMSAFSFPPLVRSRDADATRHRRISDHRTAGTIVDRLETAIPYLQRVHARGRMMDE